MATAPELDPTTPAALEDPFAFYAEAREHAPLIRLALPGLGTIWTLTRHADARAMLGDPRFAITPGSFQTPQGVPEEYLGYLHTMSEMDGPEHLRLRRLLTPAFAPRRIAGFRAEIAGIVDSLLDALPEDEPVDLLERFTKPLPMEVICAIVGIREPERPRWHELGATIVSGVGSAFGAAVPEFVEAAKQEVAGRRREPGTDLVSDLVRAATEDGDRLTDTEVVTLIWHLLLAGQTPVNLIANAVEALLRHPDQLAALRADHGLIPSAVEEFLRWCGPNLLAVPRYAGADVELHGHTVRKGEPVIAALGSANRDPRVFAEPDRLDITRSTTGHLGFGHGPHFCLGASIARAQTEIALGTLLKLYPDLRFAAEPKRNCDGGTWRLAALPVRLTG